MLKFKKMDLAVEFKKLQQNQVKILQMLSEMEFYSKPENDMYSLDDLAKMFKVTKRTIYNWKEDGRLPYVIIGSKTYVTEAQLQKFLAEHEVKPVMRGRAW
jgi:excisionase family DNA binding protein